MCSHQGLWNSPPPSLTTETAEVDMSLSAAGKRGGLLSRYLILAVSCMTHTAVCERPQPLAAQMAPLYRVQDTCDPPAAVDTLATIGLWSRGTPGVVSLPVCGLAHGVSLLSHKASSSRCGHPAADREIQWDPLAPERIGREGSSHHFKSQRRCLLTREYMPVSSPAERYARSLSYVIIAAILGPQQSSRSSRRPHREWMA